MDRFDLHLDYYGLLSLHKALLEARFHEDPENELVAGSPWQRTYMLRSRTC